MKKFIYTDDDLLKFLLGQIKVIQVDAEESSTTKIVSATIIYKNGSEIDCKLPRKLIDYLMDRLNGLFHKRARDITPEKDTFVWLDEENNDLSDKCSDANDNEDANDGECQDSCADSMCGECEATYSSKEYHELKKECVEKDHEIFLLKRKVEALEYLIYNYIPKDDRRKFYN